MPRNLADRLIEARHSRFVGRDGELSIFESALGAENLPFFVLHIFGPPTIRILFEHGEFSSAAGNLTYSVLLAYAIALPAYVATEVITRGLIALRDTRTPLFTNSAQLVLRIVLISVLRGRSESPVEALDNVQP